MYSKLIGNPIFGIQRLCSKTKLFSLCFVTVNKVTKAECRKKKTENKRLLSRIQTKKKWSDGIGLF